MFKKPKGLLLLLCLVLISGCKNNSPTAPTAPTVYKALEIYVDRATLPTIQQMTRIVAEQSKNIKLISWARYPINDKELLSSLNAYSFTDKQKQTDQAIILLTENHDIKNVVIHGNTLWAIDVINIIKAIKNAGVNVNIELQLYDDGGAEYVRLYNFSMSSESEQEYKISLSEAHISSSISGIQAFVNSTENIYGFGSLYQTTYHMLRSDIFNTDLTLSTLHNTMKNQIQQMKWDYFKKFNLKQKEMFYALTGFNPVVLKNQYTESDGKNFIFVGSNTGTATAQQQIDIISEAKKSGSEIIESSIEGYDLFFKGHPSATYNQEIISAHNMTEIYNKIPFEALIMTDTLPHAVGGMGSSVFFSLPNSVENKFVFYKTGTDIQNTPLIQVMLKLGIVSSNNVKLISELPNSK